MLPYNNKHAERMTAKKRDPHEGSYCSVLLRFMLGLCYSDESASHIDQHTNTTKWNRGPQHMKTRKPAAGAYSFEDNVLDCPITLGYPMLWLFDHQPHAIATSDKYKHRTYVYNQTITSTSETQCKGVTCNLEWRRECSAVRVVHCSY